MQMQARLAETRTVAIINIVADDGPALGCGVHPPLDAKGQFSVLVRTINPG